MSTDATARHANGLALGPAGQHCGDCAWRYVGGRGKAVTRCRQSAREGEHGAPIHDAMPACERWEKSALDCHACGACCREAYGSVTISRRDPVIAKHPELVVDRGGFVEVRRAGSRCAALAGPAAGPFHCTIYDDRPGPCRDFAPGGAHCLAARRRVGLAPARLA